MSEQAKAKDLTEIIGHEVRSFTLILYRQSNSSFGCVQIKPHRVILAHTVLKNYASQYADKPILVLGGKNDDVRKVAER